MASLVALAALGTAGVAIPASPIGRPVRDLLGAGTPLAAVLPLALAWTIARERPIRAGQVLSLGILVVSGFVALTLGGGTPAGGRLGEGLVDALDLNFGRLGGLVLLGCAAIAAAAVLLGPDRMVASLAVLGRVAHRLLGQPPGHRPKAKVTELEAGTSARAATKPGREQAVPDVRHPGAAPAESDMVILGPRAAEVVATVPESAPPSPRSVQPGQTVWSRPDARLLGTSSGDGAMFSPSELRARARVIEETLASFGVQARVVEVQQGPAITQFGLDPAPGVPVNRIVSRQSDLALRLGAPSLRVLAPVPGRALVGLEVPNASVATVKLGDLVGATAFARARLPIGIGMDVAGKPVVGDLARMPHLLVAGATGAGKSVSINALIASLLVSRTPDEVQLILIDPKQVEMSQYKGLPHLRLPVVTEMDKVIATLRWGVLEMERRYTRFSEVGARNIVAFNERFPQERLGYLVVVIDELADMMMTAADDVERLICRLAQLGRAAGVHLVVATQRPSVDVLTGLIKANLPTRLAFAVSSQIDSRVILDRVGAERLLGRGDALYQPGDEMNPRRVQGAFVSDDEIEELCTHWRAQALPRHTDEDEAQLDKLARQEDPEEKLLAQARELMAENEGGVSVAHLQRRLKIGQQKAARIRQTLLADQAAARAVPPSDES